MSSNAQNLSAIRQRLLNPNPQAPSDSMLVNLLIDQLLHHQAQLANTRNHWGIEAFTLSASQGLEDYPITAPNFGRPFLVYTQDLNDQFHYRTEVPFSLMQDVDQRYMGPQQSYSSYKWSAEEIVFYRRGTANPTWYARLVPIPSASGEYKVWFEQWYDFAALDERPGIESFHHLVRVQTAISALPGCEWGDVNPVKNPRAWELKSRAVRDALIHDEAIYQRQFDTYKTISMRDGVTDRIGYGDDYEDEWYPNGGRMLNGWGI